MDARDGEAQLRTVRNALKVVRRKLFDEQAKTIKVRGRPVTRRGKTSAQP